MTQVVSFEDWTPPARYDAIPWSQVQIEEAATVDGTYTLIDTIAITPADADPANPAARSFTTSLASDTAGLWYRMIFLDAFNNDSLPTVPIQNVADERTVYATASELATLLRVRASDRHDDLMRVLKAAAQEIDDEIGATDIAGNTTPYSNPPALVQQVNLERAVEHWQQGLSPFGILGLGGETGATYTARDSWERHALKLAGLKGEWGIA